MEKKFDLLIDTKRTGFNTVRGLKQGDNNSVLNITLVQNSIPFDLTDLTVRINYKRPDNKIFLQMADVTNAVEGKIKVNILTKALEKVGEVRADLSIFDKDNRKITSVTFSMFIDTSVYSNDYIEQEDLDLIQQIYSKEKERQGNESERIKEETRRVMNEASRIQSEKIRKSNETERQDKEAERQKNELERIDNESKRVTREETRAKNETTREESEGVRQANEDKREISENIRIKNEAEREKTHEEVKEVVTNIGKIEPYNNDKAYKKLNRVTYNGSSYEALKDVPEDVMPTNEEYWICIAEKGKDGLGSGDMHTDTYDKNGDGVVDVAEKALSVEWSNIENAPNLEEIGKVKSVNGKVGEVVLNAEDINCNDGKSVELQLKDMNSKLEDIDLTHINARNVYYRRDVADYENLHDVLTELFTFADNGKKNWVDVVGSPLSKEDSFSTLKSKTQNLKNTFASNLSSKKVSASGTESLNNLVNKISNIENVKTAEGTIGRMDRSEDKTISGLNFKPKIIFGKATADRLGNYYFAYLSGFLNFGCIGYNGGAMFTNIIQNINFDGFMISSYNVNNGNAWGLNDITWKAFGF
ncbi:phage baseplate upper protein [Clostridium tetani]|uniref:phage baseplate upper protein n=1 Tax=Clostridium tetani TaxID=1513 RepID=UPI00100A2FCB|nr:phage baseplate upper protein [Clostridium tetani]RXM68350.1 hypothetical protein DP139_12275 [Clostridium tetani]